MDFTHGYDRITVIKMNYKTQPHAARHYFSPPIDKVQGPEPNDPGRWVDKSGPARTHL